MKLDHRVRLIRLLYFLYLKLKFLISRKKDTFYSTFLERQVEAGFFPNVKSIEDTLNELIVSKRSLVRYGDGEFTICFNEDIPFQSANARLRSLMINILKKEQEHCMICIVDAKQEMTTSYSIEFWSKNIWPVSILLNRKNTYYNANIFRHLQKENFDVLKSIWKNRDILLIIGENSRFKFVEELFNEVKSVDYLYAKALNAFDEYEQLINSVIQNTPKTTLVLMSLGPTATVICFELSTQGYQAIDIGHFTNQYLRAKGLELKPEDLPSESNEQN